MRANNVVAVLLPTTAYILRIAQPPARLLIDHGECCVRACVSAWQLLWPSLYLRVGSPVGFA